MGMPLLEARFASAVDDDVKRIHMRHGYVPTYFLRMVGDYGAVGAAKRLITSSSPAEGFIRLWQLDALDTTVEAMALCPWWLELFSAAEIAAARARLADYVGTADGIERLLKRIAPPIWWTEGVVPSPTGGG